MPLFSLADVCSTSPYCALECACVRTNGCFFFHLSTTPTTETAETIPFSHCGCLHVCTWRVCVREFVFARAFDTPQPTLNLVQPMPLSAVSGTTHWTFLLRLVRLKHPMARKTRVVPPRVKAAKGKEKAVEIKKMHSQTKARNQSDKKRDAFSLAQSICTVTRGRAMGEGKWLLGAVCQMLKKNARFTERHTTNCRQISTSQPNSLFFSLLFVPVREKSQSQTPLFFVFCLFVFCRILSASCLRTCDLNSPCSTLTRTWMWT